MADHIVDINKKVLSPGAQAVLDAVFDHWPGGYNHPGKPLCIAAALRALADQLVPEPSDIDKGFFSLAAIRERCGTRDAILAIATEMENQ